MVKMQLSFALDKHFDQIPGVKIYKKLFGPGYYRFPILVMPHDS